MILPQEGVLHPGLEVPIGFLLQWCLPILLTCHRFTFFVWESVFFGLASSVLGMLLSTLQFGLIFLGLQGCWEGCKFVIALYFGPDWSRQLNTSLFSDCQSPVCLVIPGLISPGFGTPWQYGHYKRFNRAKLRKSGHERQFVFTTVHPEYFHPDVSFLALVVGALQSISILFFVAWVSGGFCDPSTDTGRSASIDRAKADAAAGSPASEPLRHSSQFDDSGVDLKRVLGILLIAMLTTLSTFNAAYWWLVLVFFSWIFSFQERGTSAFKERQLGNHRHQVKIAKINDASSKSGDAVSAMDDPRGLDDLVADFDQKPGVVLGRPPGVDDGTDTIMLVSNDFCLPIVSLVLLLIVINPAAIGRWMLLLEILLGLTASASYVDLLLMGTQCFDILVFLWSPVSRSLSPQFYLPVKLGFNPLPLQPLFYLLEPIFL